MCCNTLFLNDKKAIADLLPVAEIQQSISPINQKLDFSLSPPLPFWDNRP